MLNKLKSNEELFDTILVGGATLFGSVFSYLLQFVLGRKLSVEDYGTFNALLSLTSIVGVLAAVFGTALIKIIAEMFAKKEEGKLKYFVVETLKFSLLACFVAFMTVFSLRENISGSLNIGDTFLIVLFGATIGVSFCLVVPNSYLQGVQEFKKYSFFHILTMVNRFVFPTILVFMGLGLRGVFTAFPVASTVSFIVGIFMIGINIKNIKKEDISKYSKKLLSFSSSVVLVNFSLMALNNIDLIMVKKYFPAVDTGYYAGTMTLGKILLFGAGAVSIVMFPKIIELYSNGEYFMGRLKKLLLFLIGILIAGVFCYQVFPGVITNLFFGKAFENSVKYLPLFSVFVAFYVLINFLVMFFLAIDKRKVGFLLLPGVLVQYILLNLFHETLWDVINIDIGVSIFTLLLLGVYFYFSVPKLKKENLKELSEVSDIVDIGINPDRG